MRRFMLRWFMQSSTVLKNVYEPNRVGSRLRYRLCIKGELKVRTSNNASEPRLIVYFHINVAIFALSPPRAESMGRADTLIPIAIVRLDRSLVAGQGALRAFINTEEFQELQFILTVKIENGGTLSFHRDFMPLEFCCDISTSLMLANHVKHCAKILNCY